MQGALTKIAKCLRGSLASRLKILAYHGIPSGSPSHYDVKADVFRKQMEILCEQGYNVLGLDDGLKRLFDDRLPRNSLIITFDDAYESVLDNAIPVLLDFGYSATIFIPTGLVGKTRAYLDGNGYTERLMTWEQLLNLFEMGFSVGSHTVHHTNMLLLDRASCLDEISESHGSLVERFGPNRYYLAYPYGLVDVGVRDLVAASPYAGALCFGSILSNWAKTDRFMLKREKILSTTSLHDFRRLIDPSYDLGRAVKAVLAKISERLRS